VTGGRHRRRPGVPLSKRQIGRGHRYTQNDPLDKLLELRYTPHVPPRVLIGCEFSGIVRDQFRALGIEAFSCDLRPAYHDNRWTNHPHHIRGDIRLLLDQPWALLIAHPPCTHLAFSGIRRASRQQQEAALSFVRSLFEAPIPRIAIENPRSIISREIMPHTQEIEPWWFGDPYTKRTWLWLKNLPSLRREVRVKPIGVRGCENGQRIAGQPRGTCRSITYPGIAHAMAAQWSPLLRAPLTGSE
jgi:hypothetical protein